VDSSARLRTAIDTELAAFAQRVQLPVMPLVVNRDFLPDVARDVFRDAEAQQRLITELTHIARANRFAGYQLDFEELEPSSRDDYVRFVEGFQQALRREGMALSVAVPPPLAPAVRAEVAQMSYRPNPRAAAFDYMRLGLAADFLTLMAYDEYTAPGEPGPIASLPWVEACLRRVITFVAPRRLRLGLALYHRRWENGRVGTGTVKDARKLLRGHNVSLRLEYPHFESVARWKEGAVQNSVWVEDAESFRRRLDLVAKYRLAGFSAWRLGQEEPALWKIAFRRQNAETLRGSGGAAGK
jgi:spore germination protein YaaH